MDVNIYNKVIVFWGVDLGILRSFNKAFEDLFRWGNLW